MYSKYRLFAPGPTPVPDRVRKRMADEVLHHRTALAKKTYGQVREGLRWIFQTTEEVLCLVGTGTAAMEGSVVNFLSPGDTAIFINGGKFGERWGKLLRTYGCEAIELKVPWGHAVDPADVARCLASHPHAKAVYWQASETSTGVAHPVKELCALISERPETISVVDGITAVGVFDIAADRDHIDVLVSGSQKAFMLPPGLAFVSVSSKAQRLMERAKLPRFYLSFAAARKAALENQGPYTSAVSLMEGLDESLKMLRAEGLPEIFARHATLARATREAVLAMGLSLYPKVPSDGVTAACAPAGIDSDTIVKTLRDRWNMTIAGGQDELKGKIFRVAHMGYFDALDVITVCSALEMTLASLGHRFERGAGVAAAQAVLSP